MRYVVVGGVLAILALGCSEKVCTAIGCGPPFIVAIDVGDYDRPTTVEVVADGESATLECPAPSQEPRQVVRCEPSEAVGERFFVVGEVGNTAGRFMNISVTQQYDPVGPSEARVVVRSGDDVLFEESFEAEYGEGREINGPGCGRCYGPVIFERALDLPDEQDGG